MIFFPNCKINLGLYILGKRPDGFHSIESVFYPVELCDALEIRPSTDTRTRFTQTGLDIGSTSSEDNLCMKALRLLQNDYPQIGQVDMHLDKAIPAFAGLGGGSSDAAFTLRLLDFVFSLGLSEERMREYAAALGSDCIFFTQDKPMFVSGRGENLEPVDLSLKGLHLVLIKPDIRISTREAYSSLVCRKTRKHSLRFCISELQKALSKGESQGIKQAFSLFVNDFEECLFPKYPLLSEIKQMLCQGGGLYASLSGSGSTIFGIFEKESDAKRIKAPKDAFLWQGVLK